MRKPKVENKYNLTYEDLNKLKVLNRDEICEPLFFRENIFNAWRLIKDTAKNDRDKLFGTINYFSITIYDKDSINKEKIKVNFYCRGGLCEYKFNKFFDYKDIDNELDLEIQEKFISTINYLLDKKILGLKEK